MRIDVKKYLFVGLPEEKTSFFKMMQQLGIVHFIDLSNGAGKEFPQDFQDLQNAIKVVMSLPTAEEGVDYNGYDTVDALSKEILDLRSRIDSLQEEERVLSLDIERVQVFGDFNFEDIRYIEQQGNRKFQFFCAPSGTAEKELSQEIIYAGSDHGLDYFVAVNPEVRCYDGLIEMNFDHSLSDLKKKYAEAAQELARLDGRLKEYAKYNEYLHRALTYKFNKLNLSRAVHSSQGMLENSLFVIEGWVPVDKLDQVRHAIETRRLHMEEVAIEEKDAIPTYLENRGVGKVGEDLVHIYDTPSYTDKDPSLWVLSAFALFFAMIIGDAGYGMTFLGISFYMRSRFKDKVKETGKRFIKLMLILSSCCVLWGVLTNSFFGISLGIDNPLRKFSALNWLADKKAAFHLEQKDAVYKDWAKQYPAVSEADNSQTFIRAAVKKQKGELTFPILETFSRNIMLEIALLTGILHICLSFIRYLDRNWSGLGWILALLGGYMYFPHYLETTSMLYYVFGLPPKVGAVEGMLLMGGGLGLAVTLSFFQNKWFGFLEITNVIQVFADVLSYLRLYALALAGAILSETINEMASTVPFVIGVVLIVFSHGVNMALGIMGGVIHGLRLNFLEWYHYSFEGGGKLFRPLKLMDVD